MIKVVLFTLLTGSVCFGITAKEARKITETANNNKVLMESIRAMAEFGYDYVEIDQTICPYGLTKFGFKVYQQMIPGGCSGCTRSYGYCHISW